MHLFLLFAVYDREHAKPSQHRVALGEKPQSDQGAEPAIAKKIRDYGNIKVRRMYVTP